MKLTDETKDLLFKSFIEGTLYYFISLYVSIFLFVLTGQAGLNRSIADRFRDQIIGPFVYLTFIVLLFFFGNIRLLIITGPFFLGYITTIVTVFFLKKKGLDRSPVVITGLMVLAVFLEYLYGKFLFPEHGAGKQF